MAKSRRRTHNCWNPGRLSRAYPERSSLPTEVRSADLVDPDDPAIGHILYAARELAAFGFDLTDPSMAKRAVDRGRADYASDPRNYTSRYVDRRDRQGEEWIVRGSVVYYMRIGNRVKIGTSDHLEARLAAINPEELMVTEPGDSGIEARRHREFRDLRTRGEWFRLESPLVEHIEVLRRAKTPR